MQSFDFAIFAPRVDPARVRGEPRVGPARVRGEPEGVDPMRSGGPRGRHADGVGSTPILASPPTRRSFPRPGVGRVAMPKVDAPIVGGKLSTSDPSGSAKSIAMAVAGVGLAGVIINYGGVLTDKATEQIDSLAGTNASGDAGLSFRGEF